jgi:hypothetical protein
VTHHGAQVCFAAIRHPTLLPELADGGCITLAGVQVQQSAFEARDDDSVTRNRQVPASDMSSTFWQVCRHRCVLFKAQFCTKIVCHLLYSIFSCTVCHVF